MSFKWDRVHVWSCEIADQPGATASKLANLARAGANLEYVNTQRLPQKPGHGILLVAPITGPTQTRAARSAGFAENEDPALAPPVGAHDHGSTGRRRTQLEALRGAPSRAQLWVYVPDVDALYQQAVGAGCTGKMPPTDMFWGDRYGQLRDSFGVKWSIATPIRKS